MVVYRVGTQLLLCGGMPGGSKFRQWYAMRKSLQQRGRWTHGVPQQEEGEPPAQRPRNDWYERTNAGLDVGGPLERTPPTPAPAEPGTPDSLPELEASPTAEGNVCVRHWVLCSGMG